MTAAPRARRASAVVRRACRRVAHVVRARPSAAVAPMVASASRGGARIHDARARVAVAAAAITRPLARRSRDSAYGGHAACRRHGARRHPFQRRVVGRRGAGSEESHGRGESEKDGGACHVSAHPQLVCRDVGGWELNVFNTLRTASAGTKAIPDGSDACRRRAFCSERRSPRGQALASAACRRRQKKYESPQSTPVAAAHPHACGPSPTARCAMSAEPRSMAKPA